jgi:hypothetical protein
LDDGLTYLAKSLSLETDETVRSYFDKYYQAYHGTLEGADEFLKNSKLSAFAVDPYKAPDFSLASTKGDSMELSDFKNKVTLIVFWAPT